MKSSDKATENFGRKGKDEPFTNVQDGRICRVGWDGFPLMGVQGQEVSKNRPEETAEGMGATEKSFMGNGKLKKQDDLSALAVPPPQ
jgi:hypothetical protein